MSFLWRWLWGKTSPPPSASSFLCGGSSGDVIVEEGIESPPNKQQQQEEEEEVWQTAVQRLLQDTTTTTTTVITNRRELAATTILKHVAQRQRWDCGLACLQMIYQWIDDDGDDNDMYEWLVQHVGTQSVWTVDLVIVLHELLQLRQKAAAAPNFLFATTNLSVNPDFSNFFYYKTAFQQDTRRVQARINTIRQLNLPACELLSDNGVSMRAVAELVQRADTVAILLVDNAVMRQSTGNTNSSHNNKTVYAGHYIILAGIVATTTSTEAAVEASPTENNVNVDTILDESTVPSFDGCYFVVYNPALDGPDPVHIPIHHIEKAWRAKGTDQDIIFVTKR